MALLLEQTNSVRCVYETVRGGREVCVTVTVLSDTVTVERHVTPCFFMYNDPEGPGADLEGSMTSERSLPGLVNNCNLTYGCSSYTNSGPRVEK